MNDGVVAYLGSFEVDPGMAELYQTIFQDLFAERSRNQVQETASLDRDIDQVEARILVAAEKLVEGELDTEVYRSLKDEYDRRRSALVARRADLGDSSAERLQYVQSGLNLLTNLSSHYKSADVSGKHLLLGSIFPKNLSFDGRSFRTERPNTFVDLICKGQNDLRTIKRKGPPKNGDPSYMVARTLDSTNSGIVWDNFQVFQGHGTNTPYIQIGTKGGKSSHLELEKHSNASKQALHSRVSSTPHALD